MTQEEIHTTIETSLKKSVEGILSKKGLSHNDIITALYEAVLRDGDIPFPIPTEKIPNAETLEAMKELENGEVTRYENVEDMFKEWRSEFDY